MSEQRLMAVWEYDIPPYYLAAEIKDWYNDGSVTVKGYECLGRINPIKVLPYDADRIEELKELSAQYKEAHKKLTDEIMNSAAKLMFIK